MWRVDFDGYRRRIDGWDFRAVRHDVPRDFGLLLAECDDLELTDKIIVDREHYRE